MPRIRAWRWLALAGFVGGLLQPPSSVGAEYPCFDLTAASLGGKTLWLKIESGSAPYEATGSYRLQLKADGTYAVPAENGVGARSGTWSASLPDGTLIVRLVGFMSDATEDVLALFGGCLNGAACTSCGYGLTREGVPGAQGGTYALTDGEAPASAGLPGVLYLGGGGSFPAGANAFLFPQVNGNPASLKYKWFKDDVLLASATTFFVSLNALKAEDAGLYRVEVSNAAGTVRVSTRVEVTPAGQSASSLGRTWVKVADQTTPIPGAASTFGAFGHRQVTLRDGRVQVLDSAGNGLARWSAGVLEGVLAAGAALPGNVTLQSILEATEESGGAVDFHARHSSGYGLYEIRGSQIVQVTGVGTSTPQGGSTFTGFLWLARRNDRLVFSASNSANQVGIYAWDGTKLSVLLAPGADLPGLLGPMQQALGLRYDGETVALHANDAFQFQGNNRQGIYRYTPAAGWSEVANGTQALPDNASSLYKIFSGIDVVANTVFFSAFPPQGAQMYASDPIGKPRYVGPSSAPDLVTAQFSASHPQSVYLRNGQALSVLRPGVVEQLLGPGHRLGDRVVAEVVGVASHGSDLAVAVRFTDQSSGVYAVIGSASSTEPVSLGAPRWTNGQLTFDLTTRAGFRYQVEFTASLAAPDWKVQQTVDGDGSPRRVAVDTLGTAGFVRVVEGAP